MSESAEERNQRDAVTLRTMWLGIVGCHLLSFASSHAPCFFARTLLRSLAFAGTTPLHSVHLTPLALRAGTTPWGQAGKFCLFVDRPKFPKGLGRIEGRCCVNWFERLSTFFLWVSSDALLLPCYLRPHLTSLTVVRCTLKRSPRLTAPDNSHSVPWHHFVGTASRHYFAVFSP